MGKQIVLSDIPVNTEQAAERGFFFTDNVPDALADVQAAYNGLYTLEDSTMQDEAKVRSLQRQQEFAKASWDIMNKLSED